ncbi:GNAT family N-acetyltransferase [Staphylococcus carnosus]|uniref:N-acetyltransferase n=2 Tax=Staphylococcus carnosus TaxID=1281 RepID=B9DK80_STACT|nr:GNAT family N-acetyltransferase [Staphylococcus carnosus]ANZ34040.1 acetyltransferase [Staphylococcus carnosus]KKB25100.1 acetyltransferase [Staphylococcus carnosus]KOR14228.1 acetyltransferase [Staphylococcus carnosus]POA02102.1 N-acetyltransferase [Staphylococcus carnosus]QPT03424.1 GNAT family N-acetyltransferase [Staphylococcus carnosus]
MSVYIETERLKLRDWEEKDLLPFQKMNANRQVRRFFPSILSYRRSELDMQAMKKNLEQDGIGLFAVELKESGEWIGFVGLNYIPANSQYNFPELPFYEIGWRLIPEVWDNGIATEGAKAVLGYATEKGLKDVFSIAAESNAASRRVMEKIGMTLMDTFELPAVSEIHPLRPQVRYHKRLNE